MKVIISTNKKYGTWLKKHLEKEHKKTKGKIKLRK
jgi:predicted secreted acid phosphatase